jgi:Tetracyclin repressor-like, C-terminal domain
MDPDPEVRSEQMRQAMAQVVDSVRPFPRLSARVEAYERPDPTEPERSFEWGLAAIFDGLQTRLAASG